MAMGSRKNRKKKHEQRHQVGAHLLSLSSQELPSDGNACLQLGIELSKRQDYYRAVSALAKAAEMLPEVAQVWAEYAFALGSANRMKAAQRAYARAQQIDAANAAVLARFGEMQVNCGDYDNAIAELQRALRVDPNCTNAHTQLCWVLRTRGQVMEAIRHGEQAFAADASEVAGFYLTFAYLAADEYAQALRVCDRLLERNPRSVQALALRVSALNGVNRRDEACLLADLDSLTWAATVPTPAGYPNITRFNAELVKLVEQYPGRPHDATQTLNLFDRPEPVARALADTIHSAVQHYLSTVPLAATHPFLAQQPHNFTAEAWGTRLSTYGEAEHHFHQHAWVSGVYYVDLPEFVQNPKANSLDGCLEFCRFHSYSATPVQSDTMVVRPEPGLIVLFPAYTYHRVLPFDRPGRRISIAFNLLPSE